MWGLRQFNRITFNDSSYYFKTALYIHGANHGQFNSTWGNKDSFSPFKGLLNLKQLISEAEQQRIAKVYIAAFLDASLKNKRNYLPLFSNYRAGKKWLPNTIYLSKFEDSNTQYVFTFDHDDLSKPNLENEGIFGHNLSICETQNKKLRLAWDNRPQVESFLQMDIPENSVNVDSTSTFVFSIADMKANAYSLRNEEPIETDKGLIDFSIVIEDNVGEQVRFLLSDFSLLQEPLDVAIMKVDFLDNSIESKRMLQTFSYPLKHIIKQNARFNLSAVKSIYFVFDQTDEGNIIIDDIGFRKHLVLN